MSRIVTDSVPTQYDNPSGLHSRYDVKKINTAKNGADDPKAIYFVLRLDADGDDESHIRACQVAALAYAKEIESRIPGLAFDLRTLVAAQAGRLASRAVLESTIELAKSSNPDI